MLAALSFGSAARAEESAYCDKVRARAASEAALLFAPSVHLQGIKFPTSGPIDTGITAGSGYQFRTAVSWSPLDFYKGFRVVDVGDADCRAFDASVTLQSLLRRGSDVGRMSALRKQAAYLESRRGQWMSLATTSEGRFDARAISLVEVSEIRARTAELARESEIVRSEIALLEARNSERIEKSVTQLVDEAEARAMEYERQASHVRSLASWQVTVTGGVIPQYKPVDYFGMVQVGFNFGAFSRNANETRYLEARSKELSKASYEAREQVRRFRDELRIVEARTRRELAIVDEKLAALTAAKTRIADSDAANAPQTLALIELDTILVQAEHIYLAELSSELKHFEERASAH